MKSTNIRYRNNKNVDNFAFVTHNKDFSGYTTICPHCNEKLLLSKLTDEEKDLLKHKEIIDYSCFMCNKQFKIKLK